MSTAHLKHLGPAALKYLTEIFHLSLSKCQIRAIWKSSIIVPLLKPGKDTGLSESYRPVSLLCPASKILEKWLQPTILKLFNFAAHQHGFRSKHSTVTALCDIATAISNEFNKNKPADRTVLVAIDLSKAFDTVKHSNCSNLLPHPVHLRDGSPTSYKVVKLKRCSTTPSLKPALIASEYPRVCAITSAV